MSGYIHLHRKLMDSWIWENESDLKTVLWLLFKANWKPKKMVSKSGGVVNIDRGELVTSLKSIQRGTGLSTGSIRGTIKKLKTDMFLTSKTTNKYTHIKIINYDNYQDPQFQMNKQINKQLTNKEQTTNNDIRKKEGKKKDNYLPAPPKSAPKKKVKPRKTVHSREELVPVIEEFIFRKGWKGTEIAKDHQHWGRWMKEADALLLEFQGRQDLAMMCIGERAKEWSGVDWTISGVTRTALNWLAGKQAKELKNGEVKKPHWRS